MLHDQIICPHCKNPVPLTEALSHQVKEQLQLERQKMFKSAQRWKEQEVEKLQKEMQEKVRQKIEKEMELKLLDGKNEREELTNQNKALQEQILEMNKTVRQLRVQDEKRQIEMEKKLAEEQEKMKENIKKQVEDSNHLKMLEMDKKLHDALKVNEELRRKLEQGSQQMQGEVLELELESILKREFPYDEINPVAKGVQGADIIQVVMQHGKRCGAIIWETKRTKAWSPQWIGKLKDDQRKAKAEIAVIVSQVLPSDVQKCGIKEGVWVTEYDTFVGLACALRKSLTDVTLVKQAAVGKNEKMEVLWEYLTSTEFTHRVEAIVDSFTTLQDDIEKEKRWFATKWAKQEKNIRRVIDTTLGMHGDLQGIVGKELSEIKGLDMLPDGSIVKELFE